MRLSPKTLLYSLLASASAAWSGVPAGYTLQWEEDFNYSGAPDPDIWTYDYFSGGNGEDVTYTNSPDNARVEGGKLVIEVHQILDSRAPRYTSARLITRDKAFWKYGRIEVRAKLPSETGTWPAIWMLSNNPVYGNGEWPDTGEIDIMEHVGYEEDPLFKQVVGNPTLPNIHGTIHTSKFNGLENAGIGSRTFIETASTEFHTYAINWYEDRIEWEVDGVNYFTQELEPLLPVRNPPEDPWEWWPFDQPFYLILNVAVGGNWGGHFNSTFYPGVSPYGTNGIDDDGVWPQRMEVDYVKAYAPGEDAEWKGLPIDEFGNADTNSWLGWINVNNDPWLYSYTLQKYILMTAATEEIFHTDSQWVYIPNH